MQRMHIWAAAALAALVVGLALWLTLSPGWVVARLAEAVKVQTGLTLAVASGASLNLSPLSVELHDVRIEDPAEGDDSLMVAKAVRFPVSIAGLVTRQIDMTRAILVAPDFAFLINERGAANWALRAPKTPAALRFTAEDASLRFYDARNGQSLESKNGAFRIDISPEGGLVLDGTMVVRQRLVKVETTIRSVARVHDDGSPIDFVLDAPDLAVSFEGRIATANTLSLAGTVSASGQSLHGLLQWLDVATGRDGGPAFSIAGALDTAGRAIASKAAAVTLGAENLSGDVSIDFRGEVPRIDALLKAPDLDLSAYVPGTGGGAMDWGRNPLALGALRALDARLSIQLSALHYAGLAAGPSQLDLTLEKGILDSRIGISQLAGGNASLQVSVDAARAPHVVGLGFNAQDVDAQAVLAVAGLGWITGQGSIAVLVSGQGNTQQEIVGTLKGNAEIAVSDGLLSGLDIGALFAAARERVSEGWSSASGAATPFTTLAATFDIADGIASLSRLELANPALTLTATGDVDLLRRAVDLRVDPRLRGAADGSSSGLPVSIVVRGPWGQPRIYPDVPDVLTNPAQAFERLRTMSPPPDLAPAAVAPD